MFVGILLFALTALAGPQQAQDKDDWFARHAPKSAGAADRVSDAPAYSDCLPWLIQESERTKAREAETSGMVMGWKDAEVADLRRQLKEAVERNEQLSRRYEQIAQENAHLNTSRQVTGGVYGDSGPARENLYLKYYPPPAPPVSCVSQRIGTITYTNCR